MPKNSKFSLTSKCDLCAKPHALNTDLCLEKYTSSYFERYQNAHVPRATSCVVKSDVSARLLTLLFFVFLGYVVVVSD